MKKSIVFILGLLLNAITIAQTPDKMSFQTVVRNSQGKLVVNQMIGVRASILKTSSTGTAVYVETHTKSTNVNGLLTLEVGAGSVSSGTFAAINWSEGPYFLKTEMDVNGGANYTISGVTEFVSVPYAKIAERSLKSDSSQYSDTSNYTYKSKLAQIADTSNQVRILKKGENVGDMNYWDGSRWVALNAGSQNQALLFCDGKPTWVEGGVCPGKISIIDCANLSFSSVLVHGKTISGASITVPYSGGNAGPYAAQTISSTGVNGITATILTGKFAKGEGTLVLNLSGKPSSVGTALFSLSIGGKTCVISQRVVAGAITQMNCITPLNEGGFIFSNEQVGSGVKSKILYSDGNGGSFSTISMNSTGVSGLQATIQGGNFNSGDGELTVDYSGNPTSSGFATFNLTIGGISCSFKRMVELKGLVGSINCPPSNGGFLMKLFPASGVTSSFSYTSGNAGKYYAQQVASTGVTGLIANLSQGSLLSGGGTITYTISGTPSSEGLATFIINIGGKSCTFSRTVDLARASTSVTDVDGNSYATIQIGTQIWMKSNLKTTKYNDGTTIPNITDNTQWQNNATGAWAYHDNYAANNTKYGKLYNWYVVSPTTNGNKNVCPVGWHIPTDAEWTVLTYYLGGIEAGTKMKDVTSWPPPNAGATNTSLFTGLPSGYRDYSGNYSGIGIVGYWWSSSEYSTSNAWYRGLDNNYGDASRNYDPKRNGFSVRCLRD